MLNLEEAFQYRTHCFICKQPLQLRASFQNTITDTRRLGELINANFSIDKWRLSKRSSQTPIEIIINVNKNDFAVRYTSDWPATKQTKIEDAHNNTCYELQPTCKTCDYAYTIEVKLDYKTYTYYNVILTTEYLKLREVARESLLFYNIWYHKSKGLAVVEIWDAPFQGKRLQRAIMPNFDCPIDDPDLLANVKTSMLIS